MRKYLSNFAKRKRKSSLRRYVAVTSSPSLFQAENECKKDSQETQDFSRDRCIKGFSEGYADTMRVDFQEEALKRQHKRIMKTLENDSQQRNLWTGREEKCTEETSTEDDEQGNNNVVEWKQGARPRLKKKDSTRMPHYKDEIMLSDNIDSIVEKEIPEIAVDAKVLAEDIEYILNDDIPPEVSKEKDSHCSIVKGKYACAVGDNKGEDNTLGKGAVDGDYGAKWPRPKEDPTTRTRNTEDEKQARKVKYIVRDKELLGKSKETSYSGCWREKSEQKVFTKPTMKENEERVSDNKPVAISCVAMPGLKSSLCREEMDEEDIRVAKEIQGMIKDKPFESGSNGKSTHVVGRLVPHPRSGTKTLEAAIKKGKNVPAVSRSHVQLQVHSDFVLDSNTKRQSTRKYSTGENNLTIADKKLAEDIDYILNDDVCTGESSKQKHSGADSATKEAQRSKKCSTSENSNIKEKDLQNDIGCNLKNEVQKVQKVQKEEEYGNNCSRKVLPERKASFQIPTQEDSGNLAKDIEYILTDDTVPTASNGGTSSLLGPLPSPKKIIFSRENKEENDQLSKDIAYILNDDIFPPKPDEVVSRSSSSTELTRPKTSNPKLTLAMDMEKVLDLKSLPSTTTSCQRQMNNLLDLRKQDQDIDEMAEVIEYILSDDIVDVTSNGSTSLRSGGKRHFAKEPLRTSNQANDKQFIKDSKVASSETVSSTTNTSKCSKKKSFNTKPKYMTTLQEVSGEPDSRASKVSSSPVLQLQSDFLPISGTTQNPKTHSSKDLHTLGTISSSSGAVLRPKTRNPKRTLVMNVNKTQSSSQVATRSSVFPSHKQDLVHQQRQANYKLAKDGFVQSTSNGPNITSSYPTPLAKNKHTTKKSKDMMVLEDFGSSVEIATSSCAVSHSTQDSSQGQKLPKDTTLAKQKDGVKLQEDAASMRSPKSTSLAETHSTKKNSSHQSRQTEETALEEAIKEILDIPTADFSSLVEYRPNVSEKPARKTNPPNKPNETEENDLDEAIKEILGSLKNYPENDKHVTKEYSPRKAKPTEEIDLDEAITEVFGIQAVDLKVSMDNLSESNSRQAETRSSMSRETKRKASSDAIAAESRGIDAKKPTAQAPVVKSASDVKYPGARVSFSSSAETKNCDSGCSLASGDTLRPMAAGLSMGPPPSIKFQSSGKTRQKLFVCKGERTTVPALLGKQETAVPTLENLQSTATNRKTDVPVTCGSSRKTSSGMFYNSEELELMKQIERGAL